MAAVALVCGTVATGACAPTEPAVEGPVTYEGGMATLLTDDLLQVMVEMGGPVTRVDLRTYTDCAAADAAVFKGLSFARHVRTTVYEEAGLARADAVYTVSTTLPAGMKTIDAATQAETCRELGIPRV
ncbi:MAG: hypothetical protein AAFV31_12305 [Pseudomonadota bacterium]